MPRAVIFPDEIEYTMKDVYQESDVEIPMIVRISGVANDDGIIIFEPREGWIDDQTTREWGVIIENQNGLPVIHIWANNFQNGSDPDYKFIVDGSTEFTRMREIRI